MSIGFNPQSPNVKKIGREELANTVGLTTKQVKRYFAKATPTNFQITYNNFVTQFPTQSKMISDLRPDGVGPGELVAWFIFDNIQLGGRNSPIDLIVDGKGFAEMKGGSYDAKNHALKDFKITKDSDPAIGVLRKDLEEFNETFNRITGSNLTGWVPGNILTTTLKAWESVDLNKEAKRYAGPIKGTVSVNFSANGDIRYGNIDIGNWKSDVTTCGQQIQKFMLSDVQVPVNNRTSTLKRIVARWRQQAFTDYLKGKRFALVNTSTLKMEYLGELTPEMIGLYRIARNQPQARIYLPKGKT